MINSKFKIQIGICFGTSQRTSQGQVRDINNNDNNDNNDNNLYLFLFNKYKEQFSFKQNLKEKQEIFKECMNDEKFYYLTEEEQTK